MRPQHRDTVLEGKDEFSVLTSHELKLQYLVASPSEGGASKILQ